jgi:hypothetical protein
VPASAGPLHAHLDPEDAALHAAGLRTPDLRCSCSTPFCRGQGSADWLNCDRACRACRPPPWTPPLQAELGALHDDQG